MYFANQQSTENGFQPSKSHYVLYEDRTDDRTFAVNSNLNTQITSNVFFDGGFTFKKLKSHNFQNLLIFLEENILKILMHFIKEAIRNQIYSIQIVK